MTITILSCTSKRCFFYLVEIKIWWWAGQAKHDVYSESQFGQWRKLPWKNLAVLSVEIVTPILKYPVSTVQVYCDEVLTTVVLIITHIWTSNAIYHSTLRALQSWCCDGPINIMTPILMCAGFQHSKFVAYKISFDSIKCHNLLV